MTSGLNKTLTRTFTTTKNLMGLNLLKFSIYASRTGQNIQIGMHDTGGTTTVITPDVANANTWQTVIWDISAVDSANRDAIDQLIITVVNADAPNTFYIDNFGVVTDIFGDVSDQTGPVNNVFGLVE